MKKIKLVIKKLLYKIPIDKQLHGFYGGLIFIISFFPFLKFSTLGIEGSYCVSVLIALAFGFLKEDADADEVNGEPIIEDNISIPSFNPKDMFATLFGAMIIGLLIVGGVLLIK